MCRCFNCCCCFYCGPLLRGFGKTSRSERTAAARDSECQHHATVLALHCSRCSEAVVTGRACSVQGCPGIILSELLSVQHTLRQGHPARSSSSNSTEYKAVPPPLPQSNRVPHSVKVADTPCMGEQWPLRGSVPVLGLGLAVLYSMACMNDHHDGKITEAAIHMQVCHTSCSAQHDMLSDNMMFSHDSVMIAAALAIHFFTSEALLSAQYSSCRCAITLAR